MVAATITSKGQVTIPKEVRDSLHLRSGDRIVFVVRGEDEALLRRATKSVDDVFGQLHKSKQPVITVEEMNQAIARKARQSK
jgi:AbrB family looped-hinge helix DNA binding protein